MEEELVKPDYIFEVSWEVCNKVGGIHTVLSTKALTQVNEWEDKVIMIGPDVWKGTGEHPEFKEDINLYPAWKAYADSKGLKIKIGRWKITGTPVTVLIDFTPFFTKKDEIFKDLWLKCKVDSISGGWDYIEPALFGYAAGKVIECFYHCHLTFSDKIIAQFHEWLTGCGCSLPGTKRSSNWYRIYHPCNYRWQGNSRKRIFHYIASLIPMTATRKPEILMLLQSIHWKRFRPCMPIVLQL